MTTWSTLSKNVSSWVAGVRNKLVSYLLKEDGAYLLLETGGKIILFDYSYENQSKNNTTWTKQSKN